MNIHSIYKRISTPFRRRRMEAFEHRFGLTPDTTILDVGGTPGTWELIASKPHVTLLNLTLPESPLPFHMESIVGDGTALPFADKSFDIVFSNSVIEHLYTWNNQQAFAGEVRRVGRSYSVQTPNKKFLIEPHYLTPGIHFLPESWRGKLIRNFTVMGWIARPPQSMCDQLVDEIRLLGRADLEILFPEAHIEPEKVWGLTKSFTAMFRPNP